MKKTIFGILLILTVLLSACANNALETPTGDETTSEESAGFVELNTYLGNEEELTCTAITKKTERQVFIREGDNFITQENPAITLIIYSDFACEACNNLYNIVQRLMADYSGDIELIYRYFPLPNIENTENLEVIEQKSLLAIQAAEAGAKQEKFWDIYFFLNENFSTWIEMDPGVFTTWILDEVATLEEYDAEQFEADMFSDEVIATAEGSMEKAFTEGVNYIPYLVMDNSPIPGEYYDYNLLTENFGQIIALTRLEDIQFNECPEMTIDTEKEYFAKVITDIGDFTIQLFDDIAPFAVNSFIFLVENDWYDDVYFHRIEPGFVAQVGDPTGTGMGNPGYLYGLEIDKNLTFDRPGLVAMANSGPTSNGSQFFITYNEAAHLNGGYTIFGEVIEGMDIVEDLQQTNVEGEENTFFAIFIHDIEIIVK